MHANALNNILNELNRFNHAIEGSVVLSYDGLTMAASIAPDADEDLISAMSAALFSMGTRASREMAIGELQQVVAFGEKGSVVMIQAGSDAVLAVLARRDATLSDILPSALEAAQSILEALSPT